jgi:hypothetical protein
MAETVKVNAKIIVHKPVTLNTRILTKKQRTKLLAKKGKLQREKNKPQPPTSSSRGAVSSTIT